MILDILSRTTIYLIYSRTITGVLIDPIVFRIWTLYCHILIVLWTPLFLRSHTFYCLILPIVQDLDSLLFCLGQSHAIVLCTCVNIISVDTCYILKYEYEFREFWQVLYSWVKLVAITVKGFTLLYLTWAAFDGDGLVIVSSLWIPPEVWTNEVRG